jgi:hypothetical protein
MNPEQAMTIGARLAHLGVGENGTFKEALMAFPCSPDDGVVSMPQGAAEAVWIGGRMLVVASVDDFGQIQISAQAVLDAPCSFKVTYRWAQINGGLEQGVESEWDFRLPGGVEQMFKGISVYRKGESAMPNDSERVARALALKMAGSG